MKLVLIILISCVSFFSHATFYNMTHSPSRGDFIYPVAISPISMLAFSVSERNGEPHLYALDFKRDESFFVYSGVVATYPVSSLQIDSSAKSSVKAASLINGQNVLVIESCVEAFCDYTLITLNQNARQLESSIKVAFKPCEYYYFQGKWLHNTCGQRLDSSLLLLESSSEQDPIFTGSASNGVWQVVKTNENKLRLTYNATEIEIPISVSSNLSCDGLSQSRALLLQCLSRNENGRINLFIAKVMAEHSDVDILVLTELDTPSTSSTEDFLHIRSQISASNEHIFSSLIIGDVLYIQNRGETGKLHSERKITLHSQRHASPWILEPSQFYAAQMIRANDGRFYAPTFDYIPERSSPFLNSKFPSEIFTGKSLSITLEAQDEDTAKSQLNLSIEFSPDFISYNTDTNQLKYSPSHANQGEHSYLVVAEGRFNKVEKVIPLKVTLSPFEVLFYEASLFKKMGLDSSYPLGMFLQQIPKIAFIERDEVNFVFSSGTREPGEYEIEVTNLPPWLHYDHDTRSIKGKPLQKDVGDSEFLLTFTDHYSGERQEHKIALNVQEVNDPFRVVSSGQANLKAGESYSYTLKIEDEETALEKFNITPIILPDWLTWDRSSMTLSGIAPELNEGKVFNVQILIEEVGFFAVLHQFSIHVEQAPKQKSGGAFTWWFVGLFFIIALRVEYLQRRFL